VHAFHPVFPIYPEKAAERGTGGCAAVSVVLDNDGHAAGIRIDAEYPPGLGFGVALAQAASATIYTPGHGGETTHITVHFSAPR
jgi:pantoate kinase